MRAAMSGQETILVSWSFDVFLLRMPLSAL